MLRRMRTLVTAISLVGGILSGVGMTYGFEAPQIAPAPSAASKAIALIPILEKEKAAAENGDEAAGKHDLVSTRKYYVQALDLCRQLPETEFWAVKDEILKKLANARFPEHGPEVEALYRERTELLERQAGLAGLALGLGLFDLESYYADTKDLYKAEQVARRAEAFYKSCVAQGVSPVTCDRRMADVQGLMGCALLLAGSYRAAGDWLEPVVARKDENVRPQIMILSLKAYAKVLATRGDRENARQMEERARALDLKHPHEAH